VREASSKNRLDPDFVSSVIRAESNFKTHAVSKKGAQGLMQLMPSTAAQLGVADAFDPKANVEAGTAHLSALLDLYNNDPIRALAAYNAGAHRVKQYNGVPPYRETRDYINKIVRDFNAKKRAQMKAAPAANVSTATKATSPKPVKTEKQQQETGAPRVERQHGEPLLLRERAGPAGTPHDSAAGHATRRGGRCQMPLPRPRLDHQGCPEAESQVGRPDHNLGILHPRGDTKLFGVILPA
jgi:hypothetical protein